MKTQATTASGGVSRRAATMKRASRRRRVLASRIAFSATSGRPTASPRPSP